MEVRDIQKKKRVGKCYSNSDLVVSSLFTGGTFLAVLVLLLFDFGKSSR